jgi:saccharopine dehydrogenase-like NADP-dependent oxidoreductase
MVARYPKSRVTGQRDDDARVGLASRSVADRRQPIVALELIAAGTWEGVGVLGPEAFDAVFPELLNEYGAPWHLQER